MDISIILPLHRAKKMFTLICVIIFFILQGCGNLQKQDDDVMTNDSLVIGLCRQLEGDGTPFWLVISSILLFTGCAAGILFIKKRGSPRNSTTYCKNRTKTQSIDNKQFTLVCLLSVYSLFIDYLIFPALKFGSEPRNNYFCNMNIN